MFKVQIGAVRLVATIFVTAFYSLTLFFVPKFVFYSLPFVVFVVHSIF